MKIVIAPDSFKGSLSAIEVTEAIALGVNRFTLRPWWKKYPWPMAEKVP